ncbi:glycosyltransferase [Aquicoccus porphyridii]|uniref:Glycosyltransferase n=1 Tax=Aquicoccus porphyridii TaxID=1852029 RepID=A0A5A9Z558_9RHOB|nr:glycosyltransferase [Aquicoccus porphyridii]KAA0912326.1 glycosyltransferase [Aquicoccus porphyridii]RAI54183.1 hypothetical protein DOO74_08005 [Rhodobacteraceae bacterium AsT-22]
MTTKDKAPTGRPINLSITVAISTIGERLGGLDLPAPCPGLDYVVLVQKPGTTPCPEAIAARPDVSVHILDTIGLSRSRNTAFDVATGSLLVFADDDMTLDPAGFHRLARAFAEDPKLGFAAGWRSDRLPGTGRRGRVHRLHHFNAGRVCAPELMVRRDTIDAAGLRFDPDFGLGARFGLGEEYVFVTDALKAGLKGLSLPVAVGRHPSESTGDNWQRPDLMRARMAMLKRVFGAWAPLVRGLYALRYRRRIGDPRRVLAFARGHVPDHPRDGEKT